MSKKTSHKDEGKTLVKYHTGSANLGVNDLHKSYRILLSKINRIIPHSRQYQALLPGQQLSLIFSCSIARFACERRRISGRRLSSSLLFCCCCCRCCLFCCFSVASLRHTTGNTSAFRLQRGLWARFSYLMITQPDYSRSFVNGKIHETDNSILKQRGGNGSLSFFSGQLRRISHSRPQGLLVCQYGSGGCKPNRAHVYMHQETHQSATVLVRCVPRSSLLPPPYWKTRGTWGQG